jgi:hypothetical protein
MSDRTTLRRPLAEPPLDAEVAVLDDKGVIIAVNDSWNAFTLYNGGDPTTCGVGANYLAACERARDDANATTVAELIRAAIHGRSMAATSIVIDCHAPAHPRWFELFVSPRGDRARRGATVILLPIPIGAPLTAPTADSGRFPDVHVLHHSILRRLAAMDRLIQAMEAEATPEQIDEALRHVDAAIVALQRAAHEIDAQRP